MWTPWAWYVELKNRERKAVAELDAELQRMQAQLQSLREQAKSGKVNTLAAGELFADTVSLAFKYPNNPEIIATLLSGFLWIAALDQEALNACNQSARAAATAQTTGI